MATNTTNYNLIKPAYEDIADIADINDNMDTIDGALTDGINATKGIASVITGTTNNSGRTIASGEYFIANGVMYKATASIPSGGVWNNSKEAVSDDLINTLNNNKVPKVADSVNNINDFNLYGTKMFLGSSVTGLPDTSNWFKCSLQGSIQFAKMYGNDQSLFVRTHENNVWQPWRKYGRADWTELTGVQENVAFSIPAEYTELTVECGFTAGQYITFMTGIPASTSIRQDMGFYYTPTANGSGAIHISAARNLTIYHPYYAGVTTTYTTIHVYAR